MQQMHVSDTQKNENYYKYHYNIVLLGFSGTYCCKERINKLQIFFKNCKKKKTHEEIGYEGPSMLGPPWRL